MLSAAGLVAAGLVVACLYAVLGVESRGRALPDALKGAADNEDCRSTFLALCRTHRQKLGLWRCEHCLHTVNAANPWQGACQCWVTPTMSCTASQLNDQSPSAHCALFVMTDHD